MNATSRPDAVLTDIEGTAMPIAFVREVLFPFARTRLPKLVSERGTDPEVAAALDGVRALAPGEDVLATLLGWMDRDAKVGPLKTLQGIVWRDGWREGALQGRLYPDVGPALRAWHGAGVRLAVYSSGSAEAQRSIFGHAEEGSFEALFAGFFDTSVGGKREPGSYPAIAERLGCGTAGILFLCDVEAELDAAREAGLATCQLVRPQDGTVASERHPVAADFGAVARAFGLPG